MSRAEMGSAMPRFLSMKNTIKYLPPAICDMAAYTSSPRTKPLTILRTTGVERRTSSASAIDTLCLLASFSTTASFQMISVIRIR